MSRNQSYEAALARLRTLLHHGRRHRNEFQSIVEAREGVLERYGRVFQPGRIPGLDAATFKSFLLWENNQHWSGLHRQGPRICQDMDKLRTALSLLMNEQIPLASRLTQVVEDVPGMGKAIVTAILLVTHPDKYGVWNTTSEGSLKQLSVWPDFRRGMSFGEKYIRVNELLNRLARDLGVDLWTLDGLFWKIEPPDDKPDPEPVTGEEEESTSAGVRFHLERYLHEFLRDNWDQTDLGKKWALHQEQGDPDAGYEFPTGVGKIDLLARHRTEPRWLVVELKRNQSSDTTVGQVLRYMGWVQAELAEPGEPVGGLIVSHIADNSIRYALKAVENVKLLLYDVEFHLRAPEETAEGTG